jgi:hypothetical protein
VTDAERTRGAWTLHQFEPRLDDWCKREQVPATIPDQVRRWWPSLEHAPNMMGRRIPSRPEIRVVWVADCFLPDIGDGPRGVQCHYEVIGSHVVCKLFTIQPLPA